MESVHQAGQDLEHPNMTYETNEDWLFRPLLYPGSLLNWKMVHCQMEGNIFFVFFLP